MVGGFTFQRLPEMARGVNSANRQANMDCDRCPTIGRSQQEPFQSRFHFVIPCPSARDLLIHPGWKKSQPMSSILPPAFLRRMSGSAFPWMAQSSRISGPTLTGAVILRLSLILLRVATNWSFPSAAIISRVASSRLFSMRFQSGFTSHPANPITFRCSHPRGHTPPIVAVDHHAHAHPERHRSHRDSRPDFR